ncbi:MAG TPA: AAA-like domain-containing protein [Pyrinomonadaceae bacterium]
MARTPDKFYVIGGTLQRDAPSYVRRDADDDLYDGLIQGKFCYVLTSRQMGKSSLMVRTAVRLREEGVAVAVLDLTAVGQNLTTEQWYDGLLNRIGQQLDLEDELDDFLLERERLGPMQRWMQAIREVVLPRYPGRVVIFVDEIDAVRSLPFSTDEFFAGIREFYNRRPEDPELSRLTFCLLGVATPSDLIRDTRTTPFNIGWRTELTDFTAREALPLLQGMKRDEDLGMTLLKRVIYWTGGHPYLTQRLCQAVAEDNNVNDIAGVDRLCEELFLSTRARERDDNLLFVRERILRSDTDLAALLELYGKVRAGKRVRDDETNPLVSILRLAGITRIVDGHLQVRNQIYYRVFDREWIKSNMPDAELRRQRVAYRRGILRAAGIAALILAAMTGLAIAAIRNSQKAQQAQAQADQAAQDLRTANAELRATRDQLAILFSKERDARQLAEEQRQIAEKEAKNAEEQKLVAEKEAKTALELRAEADKQRQIAEEQRAKAESAARIADISREQEMRAREQAEESLRQAQSATAETRRQQALRQRIFYATRMNLAGEMWERAKVGEVLKYLAEQRPKSDEKEQKEDVRGFEWFYLCRLSHGGRVTLQADSTVYSVAYSPDGKVLAEANDDGTIKIWDVASRKLIRSLGVNQDQKTHSWSLAFSPDGRILASGNEDGSVRLLDVAAGKEVRTLNGHKEDVSAVAFSQDGRLLATASNDKTVKLWDVETGRELATLIAHRSAVHSVMFSPDGRTLATASADNTAILWDMVNRQAPVVLKGHTAEVLSVAFSPNGKYLATASQDRTTKFWNVASGKLEFTLRGHTDAVTSVAFSPRGDQLATSSDDNTAKLWNVPSDGEGSKSHYSRRRTTAEGFFAAAATPDLQQVEQDLEGQEPITFRGHTKPVTSIAFSPDGKTLATGSADLTVKLWDLNAERDTLKGNGGEVYSTAFSTDGKMVASGSRDNTVRIWDVATRRELKKLVGHTSAVNAVAFSSDGTILATGSGDSTIKLWDVATWRELATLKGHTKKVNAIAFSPDGKMLASVSSDQTAKLWDVASRLEQKTLQSHTLDIESVAFSSDGKTLATGSWDATAKLWDVATGRELATLREPTDQATEGGRTAMKKVTEGTYEEQIKAHPKAIRAVAFSPDTSERALLVTGSNDSTIKIWDITDPAKGGVLLETLEWHTKPITYVTFSPDGSRLATASDDMTVKLWDAVTWQELATLKGHNRRVWSVAFSPKDKVIATSSSDGTVKLWLGASNEAAPESCQ